MYDFMPLESLLQFYNHHKSCTTKNARSFIYTKLFNDFLLSNAQKFLDEQISVNNVNSSNRKKSILQIFSNCTTFQALKILKN